MVFLGSKYKVNGFTLLEVMIVAVLISIVTAIALPSYQNHICNTERQQLKMDLLAYGQALDQFYNTNNFSYLMANNALPDVHPNFSPADPSLGSVRFTITLTAPDSEAYTLTSQRNGGSCQDGVMTLSNTGAKTWLLNGVLQNNWNE